MSYRPSVPPFEPSGVATKVSLSKEERKKLSNCSISQLMDELSRCMQGIMISRRGDTPDKLEFFKQIINHRMRFSIETTKEFEDIKNDVEKVLTKEEISLLQARKPDSIEYYSRNVLSRKQDRFGVPAWKIIYYFDKIKNDSIVTNTKFKWNDLITVPSQNEDYEPLPSRKPSRIGKRTITVHVEDSVYKAFQHLKTIEHTTTDSLAQRAIQLLLKEAGIEAAKSETKFNLPAPRKPGPAKGTPRPPRRAKLVLGEQ